MGWFIRGFYHVQDPFGPAHFTASGWRPPLLTSHPALTPKAPIASSGQEGRLDSHIQEVSARKAAKHTPSLHKLTHGPLMPGTHPSPWACLCFLPRIPAVLKQQLNPQPHHTHPSFLELDLLSPVTRSAMDRGLGNKGQGWDHHYHGARRWK